MVTITLQGNADEVKKHMAELLGVTEIRTTVEVAPKEVKKASEPKKTETKPEPEPEKSKEAPAQPAVEGATSGIEAVKGVISKLMVKIGREKTVALLGEFGAKKGGELKVEDYPKFLEKAAEKLK